MWYENFLKILALELFRFGIDSVLKIFGLNDELKTLPLIVSSVGGTVHELDVVAHLETDLSCAYSGTGQNPLFLVTIVCSVGFIRKSSLWDYTL